jgi:hypothetical protein
MNGNQKKSQPGIWKTIRHALSLNANFYENAQNTPRNRRIALTIVILAAGSRALGSSVILLINRATLPVLLVGVAIDIFLILAGYYFWTLIIWKVGQWLKPIDPSYSELLSPIGFSYAPQVLNFLTLIPLLGRPIELILGVWSLLAVIVAVRQGLDISAMRAIVVSLSGWFFIQITIGSVQVLQQQLLSLLT